jgi:hypothetical protein
MATLCKESHAARGRVATVSYWEPEVLASASASKPSKTAIAADDRYCDRTLSVDINRRHDLRLGGRSSVRSNEHSGLA